GIEDLKGKTIAVPGLNFQRDLLGSLLKQAGLTLKDVKVKNVQYHLVPSLVKGRADAIFGGSANIEGIELKNRGLDPVVTPVKALGLPAYEQLVVIAREDRVAKEPEVIRGFMAALRRGTAAAIKNPRHAVEAIETGGEVNLEASRKDTKDELAATLPLLSRTGRMSPARVRRLVRWMHREGLIQRAPAVSSLLTNRYLRKQGS
ncbi:MAG TPA: ABC transporter substrate-binding protein, partial [Solirubrobacterales bacterium]|nr:ABC transporter substrate-binding protein [Solirubrobacterales bacterium]